jgi:hypothetical protein
MKQGDRLKVFDLHNNQLYYGSVINDSTFNLYDFEENYVYYGKRVVDGIFNLFLVNNDSQPIYRVRELDLVIFDVRDFSGNLTFLGKINQ